MCYLVFEDLDGTYGVAEVYGIFTKEVATNMTKEQAEQYKKDLEKEELR
ncbi:MAG: hypothetical protein LC650_03545 [Actinobacteria bacterium]|nr:hypothetical protein [Actinomycetota bacterium]